MSKTISNEDKEKLIEECEELLEKLLEERIGNDSNFENYEKTMLEIAHEVVRRRLQNKLETTERGFTDVLYIQHNDDWHGWRSEGGVTSARYRRHTRGTVTYHSLVGALKVHRSTYREFRDGPTHVPLELQAGLMERMTPAMAKSVALWFAELPSRQGERLMQACAMVPPSRSTLDRCARDLGAYAVAANVHIEPLVRANELVDPRARAIVIGLDRTGVPMRHGEGRWTCIDAGDLRRSRPKAQPRQHIGGPVQWRMDYVGTVCFVDGQGEVLATRKYRGCADEPPGRTVEPMMDDVRHALTQRPGLKICVVQDGAPEMWKATTAALRREPLVDDWFEALDWYHLDERLSRCLDLCVAESQRHSQRKRWHRSLLGRRNGIRHVLRSMRRMRAQLDVQRREELGVHIAYLKRHRRRMNYVTARQRNLPIGSGVTEGACKSLIAARAKRSGQRWSQRGLSAALHLRAVQQSDRFDSY